MTAAAFTATATAGLHAALRARCRRAIASAGCKQHAIAAAAGMSTGYLSSTLTGSRRLHTATVRRILAAADTMRDS